MNIIIHTDPYTPPNENSHLKRKISQTIRIHIPSIQSRSGYSLLSLMMLLAKPIQNIIWMIK